MWTHNAAPIVIAARKRASLYLSHLKCARQLIVTNHIRESAKQSTRRQYNRRDGGRYLCEREGEGGRGTRFLPQDGSLFRALYAHVHARTPTLARARATASEKMCIRGYARVYVCMCVYIASLVSRAYELGGHQKQAVVKKKRKIAAPIPFCKSRSSPRFRRMRRTSEISMQRLYFIQHIIREIREIITEINASGSNDWGD